ncbi:MAG: hypothetical protein WCP21_23995, partial [Armatimonadota bacterium]
MKREWVVLLLTWAAMATGPAVAAGVALSVNAAEYPSLNEAVDALPPEGGTVVLPPGRFVLKETLNLSWARHKSPQFSVNLRGAGKLATVIYLDTDKQPGLDFTGNSYWTVSDLHIMNHSANVGVLLARTPPGANGCSGEFRNIYFSGCFPIAAVYMTGAECCRFVNCNITNQLKKWYNKVVPWMTVGESCVMIFSNNIGDLKSPYCDSTGGGSNTEFLFDATTMSCEAAGSVCLKVFGQTSDVRVVSCYMHSDGLAAVYLDGTKGNVNAIAV